MEEQKLVLLPVRMKIEEGAKGEQKVTVAIDGEDDDQVRERLVFQFKKLKADLEVE